LLALLGRPGVISPASLFVVAAWVSRSLASDLFNVVEGLLPVIALAWLSFACLLAPVGEQSCNFSDAAFRKPKARIVSLPAEVRELGDSLEEVIISVNCISQREGSIPEFLSQERLDSLNIFSLQVICFNWAIKSQW